MMQDFQCKCQWSLFRSANLEQVRFCRVQVDNDWREDSGHEKYNYQCLKVKQCKYQKVKSNRILVTSTHVMFYLEE